MRYLMYTEVPLHREYVEAYLGSLDPSGTSFLLVPIRALTDSEKRFLEIEQVGYSDDQTAPEVLARRRLREAISALREAGFKHVVGRAAAESAVDAIEKELTIGGFDAVVVITEPTGVAGWVHVDLPSRVKRHIDEPAIHIELEHAS